MAAGALMAASCNKMDNPAPQGEGIQLNLTIAGPGADTKAAKKGWTSGDKLNIWFGMIEGEQTVPDLIITFNGTEWTAGALRTGCTPKASGGYMTLVYEGFNDLSSTHYNYKWYSEREWFTPKSAKERPDYWDSYCRPLVLYAEMISYTFSANTLTATISSWRFQTGFKVLIKTHASMDKAADYYNLQVKNTTADAYPSCSGAWIIAPNSSPEYNFVGMGSSNYYGWTAGVQEADGIAFYYDSFTATSADITFTLKEYEGATKTYSVTGKTLSANQIDRCVGVALDYSSFAE